MQRQNKEFQALTYGIIKAGVIVFLLFLLLTSCSVDPLNCGIIEFRTEGFLLPNRPFDYVYMLGLDTGDVLYVDPDFYYSTFRGEYICY